MWQRICDITLLRYLCASVVALGADITTFLVLLHVQVAPAFAATVGYILGIAAHWHLSSRRVFTTKVARSGLERTRQKILFVLSALLGLGVTTAIIGLATSYAIDARAAKIVAIGASFFLTWIVRQNVVFSQAAKA